MFKTVTEVIVKYVAKIQVIFCMKKEKTNNLCFSY
jgi:hypothetical protein